jgi:hypothetical protein
LPFPYSGQLDKKADIITNPRTRESQHVHREGIKVLHVLANGDIICPKLIFEEKADSSISVFLVWEWAITTN